MAVVDLGNIARDQASNANLALGVQEIGAVAGDGAGYTVANVGDVTGSGFDSFLVSSPTVTAPNANGVPTGTGQSKVYLVLGSKAVNSTNVVDFFSLTPNQRVGDLLTLAQTNQVNPLIVPPTNGNPTGFNFDGIVFTSTTQNSLLGASVAGLGDINGDGVNDFAIGAPNEGVGGTVYVIFSGSNLATTATTNVNLGSAAAAPTKVVTFTDPNAGDQLGSSVAGIGKFLNQGNNFSDLAIGAPGANSGAGAVYAISGQAIANLASGSRNSVTTIGASSVLFTGQANDRAGASLSTAGDFDNTTNTNLPVDSLLIGAPGPAPAAAGGAFAAGRAYLIYGDQTINPVNNAPSAPITPGGGTFPLGNVGAIPTTALPNPVKGLILNGVSTGRLGFAVNTAGDFNEDGIDDVMIGAPGSGSGSVGFAAVIYGQASATRPNGTFQIDPFAASTLQTQYFTSASAGDLTGYSLAPIQRYNGGTQGFIAGLAIGAPGTGGNLGAVYVIPSGASTISSVTTVSLAQAQVLTATNSAPGSPAAFGTSVSTRPIFAATAIPFYTVDQDTVDDLIIGAPGYTPVLLSATGATTTRALSGSAFAVSGLKLLNARSPAFVITTKMGVNGTTPNFSLDPTSTTTTITVLSSPATATIPAFAPFTDISQTSVFINGVAVGTLTGFTSVADVNGDNTPEASFTVPTSFFGTLTGLTTLPILLAGTTKAGVPFVASTNVVLTGVNPNPPINGGTTGGLLGPGSSALFAPRTFQGSNGGELVPAVETLEHLDSYKPLPAAVAFDQFQAAPGFRAREQLYSNGGKSKGKLHQAPAGTAVNDKYYGVTTLPHKVFVRGKFKHGQSITFTHKVKVIPRNRQKDTYTSF